jgi:hypothetical protein
VESRTLVSELLATGAFALFAGAEGAEVFHRFGHHVTEEAHGDATGGLTADLDVKVDYIMSESAKKKREIDRKAQMRWLIQCESQVFLN